MTRITNRQIRKKKRYIFILRRVVFFSLLILVVFSLISAILNIRIPKTVNVPLELPEKSNNPLFIPTPTPTKKTTVLIYHTHNDEAYYKGNKNYFESDKGRTFNEKYNVIAVGEALKKELERYNFNVIHDKSDNVSDGFNYAYDTSLKNIKKYIEKADIFIDLHRDAYATGTNKNYISGSLGKEYAFIKFVVANGKKYNERPNYTQNKYLAEKIDIELNKLLPEISKGIMEKDARLNQHISESCLLIEIGNEKNDIEQVINSTEILASAIYKTIE